MKKSVSVSNLTLDLWLDFVRPALRAVNMLEEVPAKDEWHEFTAEVIEAEAAEEIAHCMTVACFNAHGDNEYASLEEAKQMVYQLEVSIKYRPATAESLATLREALAAKIAETLAETTEEPKKEAETMTETRPAATVFPCLIAALESYYEAEATKTATRIMTGIDSDPDAGLRDNLTATRWNAYKAGTLARDKAVNLATARAARQRDKCRSAKLAHLDHIATAPALEYVEIAVEWKRNPYWGNNPTATVWTNDGTYTGHASGCGYDKLTSAVGEALNQSPAVLRALYLVKEKYLAEGHTMRKANPLTDDNRDAIHYGAGYGVLPYFEGGVGMSSFEGVFSAMGFRMHSNRASKRFDYFNVTRREEVTA